MSKEFQMTKVWVEKDEHSRYFPYCVRWYGNTLDEDIRENMFFRDNNEDEMPGYNLMGTKTGRFRKS